MHQSHTVKEYMLYIESITVNENIDISEAIDRLCRTHMGIIIAINDKGELSGILSATDIINEIHSDLNGDKFFQATVETIMTKHLIYIQDNELMLDAVKSLSRLRVHNLIVVDSEKGDSLIPIGILPQSKVLEWWLHKISMGAESDINEDD